MAAALIPSIIAAAPSIIEGAVQAKDIISKYAPTAKKVVGMLFKGHSKSPSHLLQKLQETTPEDINQMAESASSALADAQQLANIGSQAYSTVKRVRKSPQPQLTQQQINQLLMLAAKQAAPRVKKRIPKGYHNVLEQMR